VVPRLLADASIPGALKRLPGRLAAQSNRNTSGSPERLTARGSGSHLGIPGAVPWHHGAADAQGRRLARDIGAAPELADWRKREIFPGRPCVTDRQGLRDFARRAANSFHHPVGTCRMGTDAAAVVDPALRVRGVEGLRVVDASVMPSLPQAMVNAATIAIAERASDLILGRA
jgi:GMC oxidoreductase